MINDQTNSKPARILIVDDFVSNIQVLASMLQPQGYNIEFTTTGTEAIEWLQQEYFDLVLLDIMMPGMDGFEVCRRLKNNEKTSSIPIIFITAKTDEESIQKGFRVGAIDYIVKPYRETELIERVKTHITIVKQRNALINTNQAKDRLFSIIGHDLKNPVSNIYGFIKLLKENYDSFSDEKKKQYISFLFDSARQNLQLLEELLEWSRTQTNTKPFQPAAVNIKTLIQKVIQGMENTAVKKDIAIKPTIRYDGDVYVDINMIRTVLRNLIGNAIKFSHPHSQIKVFVSAIDDTYIQVDVIDHGVGISEKNREKLFQIDQHVSTSGTNQEKGTGLGLILCKEFIDRHDGYIWVDSELNKGSIFSFTIKKKQVNEP